MRTKDEGDAGKRKLRQNKKQWKQTMLPKTPFKDTDWQRIKVGFSNLCFFPFFLFLIGGLGLLILINYI